jgi:hypothetical protein
MVEVFKTNVPDPVIAKGLSQELSLILPDSKINFDLQDCDRILRIERNDIRPEVVVNFLTVKGFCCEVLE